MTQETQYQPRLENLDLDLIRRVLPSFCQSREDDLEAIRRGQLKRPQTRYSCASRDSQEIGRFLYALGHPLDEVRGYLAEAAHHLHKVFELCGTQSPFPVTVVTADEKGHVVKQEPLHPPGYVDHSLTNSARGLRGVYLALIAGDLELARSIAEMIWDPPDAGYIHPNSEVCTPDQQHLAYAVKHLLLGNPDACLDELAQVNVSTATEDIQCQAEMVRAIALKRPEAFLHHLEALLAWHRKTDPRITRRKHPDYPEWFLSIPGLGLVALARAQGLVGQVDLSNVYLPLDLLASS